jgi:hypothetical protein
MQINNPVHHSFNADIAREFGINAALILNRIIWSINTHINKDKSFYIDGDWYMYDSVKAISDYFVGIMSESSVKRAIAKLEKEGLLKSKKVNREHWNHTKWYTIDISRYNEKLQQYCIGSKWPNQSVQNEPISGVKKTKSSSFLNSLTKESTYKENPKAKSDSKSDHKSDSKLDNQSGSNLPSRVLSSDQLLSIGKDEKRPRVKVTKDKKAPKDYVPFEDEYKLAEAWELHLDTNYQSNKRGYSRIDFAYHMRLIFQKDLVKDLYAKKLAGFILFLTKRMDANDKWDGWGKAIESIPKSLIRSGGDSSKFEKAWNVFNDLWEKHKAKYSWAMDVERQREEERAMGINLPF